MYRGTVEVQETFKRLLESSFQLRVPIPLQYIQRVPSSEPLNGCFEVLSVPSDWRSSAVLRTLVRIDFCSGVIAGLGVCVRAEDKVGLCGGDSCRGDKGSVCPTKWVGAGGLESLQRIMNNFPRTHF